METGDRRMETGEWRPETGKMGDWIREEGDRW